MDRKNNLENKFIEINNIKSIDLCVSPNVVNYYFDKNPCSLHSTEKETEVTEDKYFGHGYSLSVSMVGACESH